MSRRELLLESCEERILCDATPDVSLQVPTNVKIGDAVQITATFDNASPTDAGFGPYIDLVLKATGTDGAGAAVDDGVTFINATYLGAPVTATVLTFDALGQATHPYARDTSGNAVTVNAPAGYGAGDQLVVLQLPFGSFAPTQPGAAVTINLQTSNLADANQPLGIAARGGFQYGNDALDNPATDPSIIDATYANATITPTLFTLTKTYIGPEDETATGPNFLRQYRLEIDVADGQTLTDLDLTDVLPNTMQFRSLIGTTGGAGALTSTPSTTTPGGTLTYRFDSVTGGVGVDASVTFEFFVPRIDSASAAILNANSGDDRALDNNARASGTWDPIDARDANTIVSTNPAGPEHTLTAKSIATQKGVTIVNETGGLGATPGDTLEYTIQVQVSDYYAFQNLVLTDLFSDGQRFDTSFTPTFAWNEHGATNAAANFNAANYSVTLNADGNPATPATDGSTTVVFNLSSEMTLRGADGKLLGGGLPNAGTGAGALPNNPALPFGATTATIRFRTIIQDDFSDTYPSGNPSLNPGDALTNAVSVSGDLLQVTNVTTPTGQSEADDSGAEVRIVSPVISKAIYAINGSTTLPTSPSGSILVQPGDVVTYRLRYTVPSGDVENLVLSDFLPSPIFEATQVTTFSTAAPNATPPPAGTAKWGPLETLRLVAGSPQPTIGSSAGNNLLTFTYPIDIDDPTNTSREVDILFSVTVGDDPFADGLFLTNQVQASENNTQQPATAITSNAIVQVQIEEPAIPSLQKGAVGFNGTGLTLGGITFTAPGAASTISGGPVFNGTQASAIGANDLLSGQVDAGDAVRFAIVVQNTGRANAFDVAFTDQIINPGYNLPAGATNNDRLNAINLTLLRGDGTALVRGVDYTATLTAGGLLSVTLTDNYTAGNVGTETDSGALSRGLNGNDGTVVTNGSNTLIATYDLTITPGTPTLGATLTNTATLTNFASIEGGTDFTTTDLTDTARVAIRPPTLAKALTGTEITTGNNSNTQAVIGELVTYTLTVTVPEGSVAAAQITDVLGAGLAFVDVTSVALSAGLATSNTIGTGTAPANVTVNGSGQNVAFNFGTITNSNTNNGAMETITIVYRAVVLNANTTPNNQAGTTLSNAATFGGQYTDQPGGAPVSYTTAIASAAAVTVIEPVLSVAKNVATTSGGPFAATLTGVDAGDAVFYQIAINNTAGNATAFELFLNDSIPAALTGLSIFSVNTSGFGATPAPGAADFQLVGNLLSIDASGPRGGNIDVPGGATITIVVQGSLAASVQPGQVLNNSATIRWTSMDDSVGTRSTYNAASTERTGGAQTPAAGTNLAATDQTILNNYAATSANAAVTILNVAPVKTIDATSESSTTNVAGTERVAIGEIVRYRLLWQIPEGTSNNLVFTDQLPAGLQFLNDGTATVAFVSDGAAVTSTVLSGAGLNQAGDNATIATINPSFVIPGSQISPASPGDGSDPVFTLGNVVNSDNDTDAEYVVIEFNAVVRNVAGNQRFNNQTSADTGAVNRDNAVQVTTATSSQTSTAARVIIAEPAITNVTKTVSAGPYDAGNTVTYTVTFANVNSTNAASAFDLVLSDALPAFLENVTFVSATSTGAVSGLAGGAAGNTVTVTASSMAPGATVTVTYTARLVASLPANQLVTNTASLTYSSLPGSGAALDDGVAATTNSTPGASGSATGERTGAGGEGADATVLNNYADSSTAQFNAGTPTVDKSFRDGSLTADDTSLASSAGASVVIGEQVTYDILVTLPEGVTQSLNVTDIVPAGLRVDAYQILTTSAAAPMLAADFAGSFATTPALGGAFTGPGNLTLNFGNTTVTDDNVTNNNSFVIRVQATVLNIAANQAGTPLANTAALSYTNPNNGTTANVADANAGNNPTVTVVEPAIVTTKTVSDTTPDSSDPITYTITLSNSSGQSAFDVALSDVLPSAFINATITAVSRTGTVFVNGVSTTPAANVDVILSGNTLQFAAGSNIDIATGATLTIEVSGTIAGTATPNQLVTNTANTSWTSLDGGSADERTGAGGALNDHASSGTVSFTVPQASFAKQLFSTSEASTTGSNVTIGETVTYALIVTLPEGTTPELIVTDGLPNGLQYVSSSVVTTAAASGGLLTADFAGTLPAPAITGGASNGADVTFTFGSIAVTGDNDGSNNRFVIFVTARVLDVAGNVGVTPPGQTALANTATFDITGDGIAAFTTPAVNATVVEPRMTISKDFSVTNADAGDVVTITLVVNNTGTANAYDVIVNDPFPAGRFTGFTAGTTPAGFAFGTSGDSVTFTGGTINAGASATFVFTATLTSAVAPNETLSNTATVTQATTLPGTVAGERDEPDVSGSDSVAVPGLALSKTLFATSDANTAGSNVGIGETVTYALRVTLPEGTTSNLVLVDLLPAGAQFVSYALVTSAAASGGLLAADFAGSAALPTRSGATGSGDDQTFSFAPIDVTGDNVTNNNSFLVLLTARVLDAAGNSGVNPPGQTTLANSATLDVSSDPTPAVSSATVNVTVVEPRLQITKAASDTTPDPGQTLTYTLTITHTGTSTAIAYDVLLRDTIPAGLTFDAASILVNGVAVGASPLVDANASTASQLDLKFTQLAVGGTITVSYTAALSTSPSVAATNLENTAKVYWDTDAAEDANTIRDGGVDGSPDRDLGAGAGNEVFNLNTDAAQDTERVTVNASTISGVVYRDLNANGAFGGADTGIDGVLITLAGTDLNGNVINRTTTTAGGGLYSFAGLSAGVYTLTETQPAGLTDAIETVGTNFGGAKSDALNSDTITSVTIPVQTSATGAGYNFGETLPASLAGSVYLDANNDGARQGSEIGLATVPVRLTGTDAFGQAVSTDGSTDASGSFRFNNGGAGLRPGTYTLTELTQPPYLDGRETAGSSGGNATATNDQISAIALTQNTAATGYLFGELAASSVAGRVYDDRNNDGAFNGAETGISGVAVQLTGTDDLGAAVNLTTTTLGDGTFSFVGLRPGNYTLVETQPGAFLDGRETTGSLGGSVAINDQIGVFALPSNTAADGYLFGELVASSLAGFVYNDANNDGVRDSGESGIGGATVVLSGTDDRGTAVNTSTLTLGDGSFGFANLRPGTYTLTETQPAGVLDGRDTQGTPGGGTAGNDVFAGIVLNAGVNGAENNFGELSAAGMSGAVYRDLNNDGVQSGAGETGIGGVTITLTGTDDLGAAVTRTTLTDGSGNYILANVRPGTYAVTETQPVGFLDGRETAGPAGGTVPAAPADAITAIVLAPGGNAPGNNFGELPPSSLAGAVYIDSNNDGLRDAGELAVVGATITLTGTDDLGQAVSETTTTNGTGDYLFANLRPGTYTLAETQPARLLDGRDTRGTPATGTIANDNFSGLVLAADTNGAGNNFGELRPSSISGTVFIDANNDGVIDGGETLQPNVTLTLTGTDDRGNAVNLTTTTDTDGDYQFANLRPGTYTLSETQPVGLLDGSDTLGTQGGTVANDAFTFTLVENTTGAENNFGELEEGTVTGFVYVDLNGDGLRDLTEPGIAGVTITLTGTDDLGAVVNLTTTTDVDGVFTFSAVRPGTYTLIETQPGAYLDRAETAGSAGGDATTVNDEISGFVLAPGGNATDYTFGEYPRPPVPPTPPPAERRREVAEPEPFVFAFDSFNNFAFGRRADEPLPGLSSIDVWRPALLPIAPIYSGAANPGATLVIDLYNAFGVKIGSQTVMADAGGNWLANFGSATLRDTPSDVRITQVNAPYSFGAGVGQNLRTYYSPAAINPGHFLSQTTNGGVGDEAAPLLEGLDLANPIQLDAVKYGGEFLATEGVASGD